MTLEQIKKKVNSYCKDETFSLMLNQIFELFMQGMLLDGKYVNPNKAYDLTVKPDGTHVITVSHNWADRAEEELVAVRKTSTGTLLINEGTQYQIERINGHAYQYGKELELGLF
jgi:hypothetical protein